MQRHSNETKSFLIEQKRKENEWVTFSKKKRILFFLFKIVKNFLDIKLDLKEEVIITFRYFIIDFIY